ncbi:guanine deaminase [Halothiobacillus diazotrophicus]|uniref:Guanine deaminase n=1 Tax=Halothiobacillus diazotrophicus TaxID=1860122 RepID=A0A191ZE15_9GAMM|nr:guanine deaminase [Halothiobacillus diazotrophicus]ANJ66109.1 guanine deaminase [Halothiobacillus diazotrophicus]
MQKTELSAFRAPLLHFLDDPGLDAAQPDSYVWYPDGLLLVADGRVQAIGPANELLPTLSADVPLEHWPDRLIVPGFIDAHVHLPQLGVIGSYGAQLLDWLETYTFPAERRFGDPDWAQTQAARFMDELLRHGTTSALVFCTAHPASVDALFQAAENTGMAITAGKVMMDRHAPADLCDEAEQSYRDSRRLIERWHGRGRLRYAVTPRFAPTSTPEQLTLAGRLMSEYPDVLMQTHWAENKAEIAWVRDLFPERHSYLDVYDHYGLLTERSVLAHGIHIDDTDRNRLAQTGARIAFCPTSNTFLGSGLFDLPAARASDVAVGLATDVGGGTSLSLLATMGEAYKVGQLNGRALSPFQAFYLATLGNARVLHQADETGNLEPGKQADFLVLDPAATPMLAHKQAPDASLSERLFDLMILGDDRCIQRSYVAGVCRYDRSPTTRALIA